MHVNLCWPRARQLAAVVLLGAISICQGFAAESKWVTTGTTGRLIYTPDAEGDRVLDFSNAGYKGRGTEALPDDIPTVLTISPIAGDDTTHIQNAINQIAAMPIGSNGYRGALLLQAGTYDINTQLNITASGIVLRGAGRDTNGTILHGRGTTQRALINVQGSGGATNVGATRNLIDKVVPAGSRSFRVDVPGEFSVGDKVRITHPSTQAWINALGMNNPPNGDPPWVAGSLDLLYDRTITRIEGNRVFIDAPLPQAFDKQYVNGTIRRYNWAGAINNVGIENMRGDSDFVSPTDENHAWTFVAIGQTGTTGRAEDVWVRDITARHFGYAAVLANPGSKYVTVDNAISIDPVSIVTGGRRYAYDLSGEYGLVANSTADKGRHDFVNNSSRTKGPNVFYNSSSTNAQSDTGPHQRWSTGSLFDNISVQGHDINIRNRGSLGTTHGWAGANMVVWNSSARAFRVQNPPTSQNWLVGSTGPIIEDMEFGPQPSGYYDSHGTKVTTGGVMSLYEAQMNDARDIKSFRSAGTSGNWNDAAQWSEQVAPTDSYAVALRDYLIGDVDQFTYDGTSSVDNVAINAAWQSAVASSSGLPITKQDDLSGNENVAFTIQHTLDPGDRVIHGFLALALKQSGGGSAADDFIRLFDMAPENQKSFIELGWSSQINSSQTFVGVIDLGDDLDHLQTGSVNLQISNNTGVDWAIYTVAVAVPKNNSASNQVFINGGGVIDVNSTIAPVRTLAVGGTSPGELRLTSTGEVNVFDSYSQSVNGTLGIELTATNFGTLDVGGIATLAGTLDVTIGDSFHPTPGDSFTVITAQEIIGSFNQANLPVTAAGVAWHVDYQSTTVAVTALYAADFNADGHVDATDLAYWQIGYGSDNASHADGDADGDGDVDGADFLIWQRQFGSSINLFRAVTIPEPTALVLALAGMLRIIPGRIV